MVIITRFQIKSDLFGDTKVFSNLTASGWILIIDRYDVVSKRQLEILGHMKFIIPIWDLIKDREKLERIGALNINSVPCFFNVYTKKYKSGILSLKKVEKLLKNKKEKKLKPPF